MNILIIGAGGHGQVVADILLANLKSGRAADRPIGFLDDDPTLRAKSFLGIPVLGLVDRLASIAHDAVILAIGNNRIRQTIFQRLLNNGENFANAVHPSAIIGTGVGLETGIVICAGVVINTGTKVGQNVILNTGCTVDHHNIIENHAHIAPGVHLGGDVTIGKGTLVGIGATVMPQRQVGCWSKVGAGAVVTRNVPAETTVVGIPAEVKNPK